MSSLRSRRRAKATTPRPSDEIALELDDIDLARGTIRVCKAHVMMRDKDWTKTGKDRTVELCPRASEVLKRQLALRARYQPERKELYNARHSFVSWSLMIGKNVFWLAKQLGHSVQTMLTAYAAWERTPPALLDLVQAGRRPLRTPGAVTRTLAGGRK